MGEDSLCQAPSHILFSAVGLSYLRSFKNSLANAASADIARQVVAGLDDQSNIGLDLRLSVLKPKLVLWVDEAIGTFKEKAHHCEKGWNHVRVEDDAWEDAVRLAAEHHAEGKLFQKCQTNAIPENPPEEGEIADLSSSPGGPRQRRWCQ